MIYKWNLKYMLDPLKGTISNSENYRLYRPDDHSQLGVSILSRWPTRNKYLTTSGY